MSGIYIEGKKNGIGREYTLIRKVLLFEGQYLNGKRHGKGVEYGPHYCEIFEGEYLNGKRHGRGKEHKNCDTIYNNTFEGVYLNGYKIEGLGYDSNYHTIF